MPPPRPLRGATVLDGSLRKLRSLLRRLRSTGALRELGGGLNIDDSLRKLRSWLLRRRVHDEPVQVVGQLDLAGQPAGRASVGHAEVEHGVLEVARLTDAL